MTAYREVAENADTLRVRDGVSVYVAGGLLPHRIIAHGPAATNDARSMSLQAGTYKLVVMIANVFNLVRTTALFGRGRMMAGMDETGQIKPG